MSAIEARLIEWCRIESGEATTGTADAAGMYTTQKTYASSRCLFSGGAGGTKVLESGEHVSALPTVLLPATAAIAEGLELVGLVPGYLATYLIRRAVAVRRRALDHYRCDLEAIA